jgi:L-amino acid N-acyltransferase YncA
MAEFGVFAPFSAWWWRSSEEPDLREPPGARGDQRLFVGLIEEMRSVELRDPPLEIRLHPDRHGSSYREYTAIFDEFTENNPTWQGRIEKTGRLDYRACGDAGGLYTAEVDGEFGGVIAALPGTLRGVAGWVVYEEILAAKFRGRGLGSHLQALFACELDIGSNKLLLGTIDEENIASIRTAARCGRRDIGGWVFVSGAEPSRRPPC